ncbi:MAG: homoserine O-acetyltransferase [Herpetosiphonaceae bacterium]|nr:MAG: homoserine O-acetyltransferase [Herpetosiphonaceae bacterium]
MAIGDVPVVETAQFGRSVGVVQTRSITFDDPLELESGARLAAPWTLAYETYGQLDERGSNAILICHALSGDAHVAGLHSPLDTRPGWWDAFVGPGRAFDTDHYFVICSNVIGGCAGSTGPASVEPGTERPYGSRFPFVTIGDMVAAQARLLDALGIERLLAVAGGSMGGMQALQWAAAYPERVGGVLAIATTARSNAMTIALNAIGRQAIMRDPNWRGGDYYSGPVPADGLAIARMVGHISYLSEQSMAEKFDRRLQWRPAYQYTVEPEFAVESYLDHQGRSFVRRFDANSYMVITKAMDYFDLPGRYGSLRRALGRTGAHFLVLSFTSDWLYPTSESLALTAGLRQAGRPVIQIELASSKGHDAFLIEDGTMTPIIAEFLAGLD